MKDPALEEEGRAGRQHIGRIMEGINAREDFLTGDDVTRFCRRPHGFWRSDDTVSAVQLSKKNYGKIHGLAVTPTNEPCITAEVDGWITAVCGAHRGPVFSLMQASHLDCPIQMVRHLGFCDGLPVTEIRWLQILTNMSEIEWFKLWPTCVYVGNKLTCRLDIPVYCVTVLSDGGIIYILEPGEGEQEVYLDGTRMHFPSGPSRRYGSQWLRASDHRLYATWYLDDYPDRAYFGSVIVPDEGSGSYAKPVELVELPDGINLLWEPHPNITFVERFDRMSKEQGHVTLPQRYERGLMLLPDGRRTFVARARHEGECVQIEDQALTSFDRVTRPFQKDDGWYYYGLEGRFLCTMRLPL